MGAPIRCGSSGVPAGSIADGKISDPRALGAALRQLLARSEIREPRAMLAIRDTLASFRIINLAPETALAGVESVVAKELSLDPERMGVSWVDVVNNGHGRVVYATAWDRELVKAATDAVREAGVDPVVVDLKSACLTRTVMNASCILVDASTEMVELVVIEDHMPRLWLEHPLSSVLTDDLAPQLLDPLRTVLGYQARRRGAPSEPKVPILISSDHPLAPAVLIGMSKELGHTVESLPPPPRTSGIRYSTYLTCIGLLMRRS